jgi:FkbM family methyltransferase
MSASVEDPPVFAFSENTEFVPWANIFDSIISTGVWMDRSRPAGRVHARMRCCASFEPRHCVTSFWIRPGTTDLAVLGQVVAQNEYGFLTALDLPIPRTILDAGANCGIASVLFAVLFPHAFIVSVEASENNFVALRRNVDANARVHALNAALWGTNGNLSVVKGSRQGREWDNQIGATTNSQGAQLNFINGITIPDLLQQFHLSNFDFMKLDIEGSEKQVFSAPKTKYWLSTASFVAVEIHEDMQAGAMQAVFDAFSAIGTFCHLTSGEYDVWLNNETPMMMRYCAERIARGTDCCGR